MEWEHRLFRWLQAFWPTHRGWIEPIGFVAKYLALIYPLACLFIWFWRGPEDRREYRQKCLLRVIASLFIVALIAQIFQRYLIPRARPFEEMGFDPLIFHVKNSSFPSDYAAFSFAFAVGFLFLNRYLGVFMLVVALLIGGARVYLGLHWPTDIIGGAVIGSIAALLPHTVRPVFIQQLEEHILDSLIRRRKSLP